MKGMGMTGKKDRNGQKTSENRQNSPKSPFSSEWIASESLLTVFASLWVLHKKISGQIDGSRLAQALQRLVRAEVAPGGPYADVSGAVDTLANSAIAFFLREQGVQLSTLELFVAQFEPTDLEERLRAAALLPAAVALHKPPSRLTAGYEGLLVSINVHVRADMAAWPEPLASAGERVFTELLRADTTGEIRLLAQLFTSSLTIPSKARDDKLVLLGTANVFFWIGGMLFDDFLDEEGRPELLPIATASHRHALALYRHATANQPELYEHIEMSCLRADRANAWEATHTRARVARGVIKLTQLPDYGDRWVLADRSIGHLFGPLLIARQLPVASDVQLVQLEQGLRHYLIARQLNDDIHDWRKDLKAGQLSAVVVELLRGASIRPGNHRITTLVPKIEHYFMDEGLRHVYDLLQEHVALARESLVASSLIASTGGLEDLIARQEFAMHTALKIHADHQQFLAIFTE
jgi:hypothetical protein